MAEPTITFNIDLGHDTLASGAGPATAVSGTQARTRAGVGGSRIGLMNFTLGPPLGTVTTDGTSAIRVNQGAGRKFSKITAKKDTRQTPTGDTTNGSAVVNGMSSTAGLTANDMIVVIGAGAAGIDLYTEIQSVDSGVQITLKDNCSVTLNDTTLVCPYQVTVVDTLVVAADTNFGIGGRLLDESAQAQLWSDYKAGWTVCFEHVEGKFYTMSTQRALGTAGDTTAGRFTVKGLAVGGVKPTIRGNSTSIFAINNALINVMGIHFTNATGQSPIVINNANSTEITISECDFNRDGLGMTNAINIGASTTGRIHVHSCHMRDFSNAGILVDGALAMLVVENSLFWAFSSTGKSGIEVTTAANLIIRSNVFYNMEDAIELKTSASNAFTMVENNTFDGGANCFDIPTSNNRLRNAIIRNNIYFDNSPGSAPSGSAAMVSVCDYNFADPSTAITNIGAGPHDVIGSPNFLGAASEQDDTGSDWATFGLEVRGAGWPDAFPLGVGQEVDVGALQRRETVRGNVPVRITAAEQIGNEVVVSFHGAAGAKSFGSVSVNIENLPASDVPDLDLMRLLIRNHMRYSTVEAIVGKEMTV